MEICNDIRGTKKATIRHRGTPGYARNAFIHSSRHGTGSGGNRMGRRGSLGTVHRTEQISEPAANDKLLQRTATSRHHRQYSACWPIVSARINRSDGRQPTGHEEYTCATEPRRNSKLAAWLRNRITDDVAGAPVWDENRVQAKICTSMAAAINASLASARAPHRSNTSVHATFARS